ncbi:hypothetical protein SELMODRAFT_408373 [Selaginella moellendorffii]|uniref:Pyrrolo-quinoline quinone repeat domain-containing protein n=1 Tax=Selaginella moellendorffii TaxID=88036 RepID=D8R833_SELML|nr:uncharacterized protein LOC9632106 [Selaginella moellendorffii]EFJ31633.1 hypothetical protein SELMODRAFT_408373 [Selaginella moellendorffii]|eukprot:XP_002967034.1 uncharacterized protein LOC9632106 [Selaginella moellendorffii]
MAYSITLVICFFLLTICECDQGDWTNHGGDITNRRFQEKEHKISPQNAHTLAQKWRFVTGPFVSATPAIYKGVVYVPTWSGLVFAVSMQGSLVWRVNLTQITGLSGVISRTSPALTKELVIIGLLGPAKVVALKRETGKLVWISQELEETPLAKITMSGTAHKDAFYVGISSDQEVNDTICCTFQGSFQKLSLTTGSRIWKTGMLPDNHGQNELYSGAAIWGSSPSIDEKRGLVYIATGNLYTVPASIQACLDANRTGCFPSNATLCDDAVVALDTETGAIRWCNRLGGGDVFSFICRDRENPLPKCPSQPGPDYDFGESPMLVTIRHRNRWRDVVVTGQKSGIVWAHDRSTGELVWETLAGPGSKSGGAIWGAAADNTRIYTNIVNRDGLNFTLIPSSNVTRGGGWVAMDANTGAILWSTANPTGALAYGAVAISNDVLFVGSFEDAGYIYALDARNGRIVWRGMTNSKQGGGFSVADGCAFVGSGYMPPTTGDSIYAFCVA